MYTDIVTSTALVFICLISFEPFILSDFEFWDQIIIDTIITSIVLVVLILKSRIASKIIHSGKWTIKKDLIAQTMVQMAIATLIVSLSPLVLNTWFKHPIKIDGEYTLIIFGFVNLIGFMLYFIYVSLNFIFQTTDSSIEVKQPKTETSISEIRIEGKNKGEILVIPKDNLICISTNGHYLDIIFIDQKSKKAKKVVFRNSILTIADSFKKHKEFVHCHRSHLINIRHVQSISGNSKKTEVNLEKLSYKVPVSRAQKKDLEEKLKNLS